MPELPEVETVMRGLEPHLTGARLTWVEARRPDLRFPIPDDLVQVTMGQTIQSLSRRAKYMLWHFEHGMTMLAHLGMSGRMLILPEPTALNKHDHIVWRTDKDVEIRFQDPRRFGFVDLFETANLAENRFLSALGPEPLGDAFNASYLLAKSQGRKTPLKSLILDQKTLVGVGNIYASEALFNASLHPLEPAGNLRSDQAEALVQAIKTVLTRAIAAGGSSLKDYRQADGTLGYFQHAWSVYGRAGEACKSCGAEIESFPVSNRNTFVCPACQRLTP